VLHTLVGYADQPSGMQVVAWLATLAAISAATRFFSPVAPTAAPTGQVVSRAR
jgi:high-affinity iron transporter